MSGRRSESRLASLAIRLAINAIALWLASELVTGFEVNGWQSLLALAAIFGVVNALIKPVAQLAGCPLTIVTLGLFALVINAAMLALAVWIGDAFGLEVEMDDFWAALFAALLVSITSWLLNIFLGGPLRRAFR